MASVYLGISLCFLVCIGILLARLGCYQMQVKHLIQELQNAQLEDTNLLITSAVNIGRTPRLICELNRTLEKTGASRNA